MKKANIVRPSTEDLEAELNRVRYHNRYQTVLRSTVYSLITVAAAAVLVATLWLPVLRIYGNSMTPTLQDGQIVCSVKTGKMSRGDIVAFYYNNKVLIKRVIANAGDWVEIDENGTVYVNDEELIEPYVKEKSLGDADIEFPYQVPDGKFFVLGDHRETSADSRHTTVGCIDPEQLVGKIVFCVWPMDRFGAVK